MSQRSRRRQRHVINRRWSLGLVASVLVVAVGIVGIVLVQVDVLDRPWVYGSFAVAALGAVSAMIQTIVRNKSGDDIDEAKL
jgi:hypothetical protein